MRLLSHWNLRDQIKADYSDDRTASPSSAMIAQVMDRIVTQTIPEVVVDNPHVDWDPRHERGHGLARARTPTGPRRRT